MGVTIAGRGNWVPRGDVTRKGRHEECSCPRENPKGWAGEMTCDYNGWNDAPEDEREWFDQHPEIWGARGETDLRPLRVTAMLRWKGGGRPKSR